MQPRDVGTKIGVQEFALHGFHGLARRGRADMFDVWHNEDVSRNVGVVFSFLFLDECPNYFFWIALVIMAVRSYLAARNN